MHVRLPQRLRAVVEWGRRFGREWSRDNAALLAAGVAFYAIFSLAPLLSLMVLGASTAFEPAAGSQRLVTALRHFVSPRTAAAIADVAAAIAEQRSSDATVISTILLIFGASAVFNHLRAALDIILDVPRERRRGWLRMIIARVVAVATAIAVILFILLSVAATAAIALVRRFLPQLTVNALLFTVADFVLAALVLAVLAAAILRYTPDIRLPWRAVIRGAGAAALLFSVARFGVSQYLAHADVLSAYGAAGSLFIILVAVYCAVLSLFAGAEIAELAARSDGGFVFERARRRQTSSRETTKTEETAREPEREK